MLLAANLSSIQSIVRGGFLSTKNHYHSPTCAMVEIVQETLLGLDLPATTDYCVGMATRPSKSARTRRAVDKSRRVGTVDHRFHRHAQPID